MQVLSTTSELQSYLQKAEGKSIGFVPTMGALHQGHLNLVQQALDENAVVVVSIFVNPTQFDNADDLEKYPNTLAQDIEKLSTIGANTVFTPTINDIYGENVSSNEYNFGGIEKQMEGQFRKGHFEGVATIVEKLFDLVQPTKAYFGEKDFQQLQIVKKMVALTEKPVEVIGCTIVREEDGLAMSSRNLRLSKEHRAEASIIYETLKKTKASFKVQPISEIQEGVALIFQDHSLFDLEYFEIADIETLQVVDRIEQNKEYRAFIAVFAGDVRLIDNIAL